MILEALEMLIITSFAKRLFTFYTIRYKILFMNLTFIQRNIFLNFFAFCQFIWKLKLINRACIIGFCLKYMRMSYF